MRATGGRGRRFPSASPERRNGARDDERKPRLRFLAGGSCRGGSILTRRRSSLPQAAKSTRGRRRSATRSMRNRRGRPVRDEIRAHGVHGGQAVYQASITAQCSTAPVNNKSTL